MRVVLKLLGAKILFPREKQNEDTVYNESSGGRVKIKVIRDVKREG